MVTFSSIRAGLRTMFANKSTNGVIMPAVADRPRYYAHYPKHPSRGLTPTKLTALLDRAERGDMEAQAELISDIMEKEPTLAGLFQTRAYAVLAKRWEIRPNDGATESRAKRQAAWLRDVCDNLSLEGGIQQMPGMAEFLTFDELREYLLTAPAYGFTVALLDWDAKDWTVRAARAVEHKHFRFGRQSITGSPEYNPYELRYLTGEDQVDGITLEPNQAVVHLYKAKPVLPSRYSLLRTLAYWYMFKLRAMSSMVRYGERFGDPLTIGYYDPSNDGEREAVEAAVAALGQEAAIAIARAVGDSAERVQFVEPSGASTDVHDRIISIVNDEYAKCVLGHSSAAEATPGKLGEQTDSLEAQNYRIERDAIALDRTLTEQFLRPMAVANDGELLCHFKTVYEREEDQNEVAKRYQSLATIPGYRIPAAHINEVFNIPEPTDGEETVGTPALTDPAAIMATQAARQGAQAGAAAGTAQNARTHAHNHAHHHHNDARAFAYTQTPGYAARMAAARKARAAEDAELSRLMTKAAPIYAGLVNGLKIDRDIRKQLDANLADFRKELEPLVLASLIRAGNAQLRAFGLGNVDETLKDAEKTDAKANAFNPYRPIPNAADPFALRDAVASDFLAWQAFTMTVIEGEKVTEELFERIGDAVKRGVNKGISQREFLNMILDESGLTKTNGGHMQTVFRTNLATAANASKLYGMAKHAAEFPGWQFLAIEDADTTPECMELNGKIFSAADRTNFPPLHFNCRSMGSPVGRDEWEAEGYEADDMPALGQDGFENTAVKGFNEWVEAERTTNERINALIQQKEQSS